MGYLDYVHLHLHHSDTNSCVFFFQDSSCLCFQGLIPKKELGDMDYLEQTFQTGQLIKCYVINCDVSKKRLALSTMVSATSFHKACV